MSSTENEQEKIQYKDLENITIEPAQDKKNQLINKFKYFLSLVWIKLNDWLDLKGIEHKLPEGLQKRLPENKRLVTLPIFIFISGIFLIFLLALFAPSVGTKKTNRFVPVVRVIEAQLENIQLPVFSQGMIKPKNEIQILSLVSGPVIYVSPNLVDGGVVKEGELLLQVSDRSYQQDKAKVEANLARAKSAQIAKQSELRVRGTLRTDAGVAQLREVNTAVTAAEADLARMDDLIANTQIKAPFDGMIRQSKIQNGQMLNSGVLIASIFSTNTAELNLPVSDRDLALLSIPTAGDTSNPAKVIVSVEFGGQKFFWEGKLIRLAGRNEVNRLQYLTVEIEAPYADDPEQPGRPVLSPGFFVQAEIKGKTFNDIIRLPRKVLKSNQKIWMVDQQNKLKSVDTQILYKGRDNIFIKSGLKAGDKVVLSDLDVLANGIEVDAVATEKEISKKVEELMQNKASVTNGESVSGEINIEEQELNLQNEEASVQENKENAKEAGSQL